ncbi:uncharacterized protein LOC129326238 [Eublepharis macularius]|uniref:Uncharacterized protein LOC129326238 n=1 Tax=Eublepharis macularius TaxID=481883 RepID=A0AA97J2X3_EUBMA|nr:uncharacterized protein LOC129326238 [Eublepharis macularius]
MAAEPKATEGRTVELSLSGMESSSPPLSPHLPHKGALDAEPDLSGQQAKANILAWIRSEIKKSVEGAVKDLRNQAAIPGSEGAGPSIPSRKRHAKPSLATKSKRKKVESWIEGDSSESEDSPSGSDLHEQSSQSEEGELSDEEEEDVGQMQTRLFPQEVYNKLLAKVLRTLEISQAPSGSQDSEQVYPQGLERALPKMGPKQSGVPLPAAFHSVLKAEWDNPAKPKTYHSAFNKFYSLTPDSAKQVRLPTVDDPVSILATSSILPMDAEGVPKDPSDKKIEQALRRNYEASSAALRASATASLFARAAYTWASDLAAAGSEVPKDIKNEAKKIALTSAFAADATLDAFQMSSRAMGFNVTARHNTWLRNWDVDPQARSRVAAIPFSGSKLFGEALDRYLVEDTEKKKVLPSRKKDVKYKGRRPFRDNKRFSRPGPDRSFRNRWQSRQGSDRRSFTFRKSPTQAKGQKKGGQA